MSTPARPTLPAGLYALCDDTLRPKLDLVDKAQLLLKGGVKVLQLRMKQTPLREAVVAARSVAELCRLKGALCIINDRVELALVSNAHGVHLGADDLAADDARRLLGEQRLVGMTTRSGDEIRIAGELGADHVGLGPVFVTTTKQVKVQPLGIERLRAITASALLPVVAIGGITLDNIEAVARAGAHCAAVGADLYRTDDIPARVRALSEAFARGRISA